MKSMRSLLVTLLLCLVGQVAGDEKGDFNEGTCTTLPAIAPLSISDGVARLSSLGKAQIRRGTPAPSKSWVDIPLGVVKALPAGPNTVIIARSMALDEVLSKDSSIDELQLPPNASSLLADNYLASSHEIGILTWTGASFQYRALVRDLTLRDFTDWSLDDEFLVVLAQNNFVYMISLSDGASRSVSISRKDWGRPLHVAVTQSTVVIATSSGSILHLDCRSLGVSPMPYGIGLSSDMIVEPHNSWIAYSPVGGQEVLFIDTSNGDRLKAYTCPAPVLALQFSRSNHLLAARTTLGITLFDTEANRTLVDIDLDADSTAFSFAENARLLISERVCPSFEQEWDRE